MKISIIYYTMTGHSKKIATTIGKELNINPEDVKTIPKMENVDLMYIISGIYGGKSSPELIAYVTKLTKNQVKKVVLITSSCDKKIKATEIREALNKNGIEVLEDEFVCPGGFLFFGGHPNKKDIKNALNFVKKLTK